MTQSLVPVGYLGFGEDSYRDRADHARHAGVELLFMPRTAGNLRRILKNEPITIRSWNGTHMEEREAPLPYVWYDRTNVWPDSSLTDQITHALTKRGVRFINDRRLRRFAGDKWRQYRFLSRRGIHMPLTAPWSTGACVSFLKEVPTVFVKKRDGAQGKDTLIITKHMLDAGFTVRDVGVAEKDVVHTHEFDDVQTLTAYLATLNLEQHIAQRGVHVDTVREDETTERVYDFRVIFQRGRDGAPRMTLAYIRVGAPNSRQANIHQEGHAQDIESVFTEEDARSLYRRLRREGGRVFRVIASRYDVGEAGLDFVLDTDGQLWLLEVNARPGSSGVNQLREWVPKPHDYVRKGWLLFDDSFTNARRRVWGRRYLTYRRNPYRYALYLASARQK